LALKQKGVWTSLGENDLVGGKGVCWNKRETGTDEFE
jgi:hypothetical protein